MLGHTSYTNSYSHSHIKKNTLLHLIRVFHLDISQISRSRMTQNFDSLFPSKRKPISTPFIHQIKFVRSPRQTLISELLYKLLFNAVTNIFSHTHFALDFLNSHRVQPGRYTETPQCPNFHNIETVSLPCPHTSSLCFIKHHGHYRSFMQLPPHIQAYTSVFPHFSHYLIIL